MYVCVLLLLYVLSPCASSRREKAARLHVIPIGFSATGLISRGSIVPSCAMRAHKAQVRGKAEDRKRERGSKGMRKEEHRRSIDRADNNLYAIDC